MIALAYIVVFTTIFAVLFAFRNYWQWVEKSELLNKVKLHEISTTVAKANSNWHRFQFGIQLLIGVVIAFTMIGFSYLWYQILIGVSIYALLFWILFDGITGFKMTGNWFYLGTSSDIDKWGKWTWYVRIPLFIGLFILWFFL